MKTRIFFLVILLISSSCAVSFDANDQASFPLAAFTENDVLVSIHLDSPKQDVYLLSATFTPSEGYHLYSKDIPLTGVDGLGRPTLLELTSDSRIMSLGELTESVKAIKPNFEPKELLVYPSGAVTLSLPIELPQGTDWIDETVSVTYMSCSERGCKAPVMGKPVQVRIPSANTFSDQ